MRHAKPFIAISSKYNDCNFENKFKLMNNNNNNFENNKIVIIVPKSYLYRTTF